MNSLVANSHQLDDWLADLWIYIALPFGLEWTAITSRWQTSTARKSPLQNIATKVTSLTTHASIAVQLGGRWKRAWFIQLSKRADLAEISTSAAESHS
jgi:hypothetical protein